MIFIRVLNGNNPRLIFIRFLADLLHDPYIHDQDSIRSFKICGRFCARSFKILYDLSQICRRLESSLQGYSRSLMIKIRIRSEDP